MITKVQMHEFEINGDDYTIDELENPDFSYDFPDSEPRHHYEVRKNNVLLTHPESYYETQGGAFYAIILDLDETE